MDSTKGPLVCDIVLKEGVRYAFEEWDGSINIVVFFDIDKENDYVKMGYVDDMTYYEVAYNYVATRATLIN